MRAETNGPIDPDRNLALESRTRLSTPTASITFVGDTPSWFMSAIQSSMWLGLIRRTGKVSNRSSILNRQAVE
jgi:hypothetical protein